MQRQMQCIVLVANPHAPPLLLLLLLPALLPLLLCAPSSQAAMNAEADAVHGTFQDEDGGGGFGGGSWEEDDEEEGGFGSVLCRRTFTLP
jgi:hypothetical protein